MIFQKENFIPNLDYILPSLHKQKLYDKDEFTKKFESCSWPGFRSQAFPEIEPFFVNHLSDLLSNLLILKNTKYDFTAYTHLRLKEDESKDWIHKDDKFYNISGLVYLNETNYNSGTLFYDDNENVINDVKYVKNRIVLFNSNYFHKGYGYYGDEAKNGRYTLNLFIKTEK